MPSAEQMPEGIRHAILRRIRIKNRPNEGLLQSLRSLARDGAGPDRGLDCMLSEALGLVPDGYWREDTLGAHRYEADWLNGVSGPAWTAPELTGSTDAAGALVERVLTGHKAGYQPCIGGAYRGHIIALTDTTAELVADARGPSAPIAILIALLSALLSRSERGGGDAVP